MLSCTQTCVFWAGLSFLSLSEYPLDQGSYGLSGSLLSPDSSATFPADWDLSEMMMNWERLKLGLGLRPPNQISLLELRVVHGWGGGSRRAPPRPGFHFLRPPLLLRPFIASLGLSAAAKCVFPPAPLITSMLSTPQHSFLAYYLLSLSSVSPHLS